MKALNVAVRDTPVGLVACLPPSGCEGSSACPAIFHVEGCYAQPSYGRTALVAEGDVLAAVTKCERCGGEAEWHSGDTYTFCETCDGTSYAPLRFVKVLDVWPIVRWSDQRAIASLDAFVVCGAPTDPSWQRLYVRGNDVGRAMHSVDLPDAEPGGVALHVEWSDCPTCGGKRAIRYAGLTRLRWQACPTCQTSFVPPSDAPIVEVAP